MSAIVFSALIRRLRSQIRRIARPNTERTPKGTPTPTPMSIDLFDGDDGLDEGVATEGKVVGNVEDTGLLDSAGGSLADVEDVGTLVETTERDDMTAGNCDVEVEPLTSISGVKKSPRSNITIDVLQQLSTESNTLGAQQ